MQIAPRGARVEEDAARFRRKNLEDSAECDFRLRPARHEEFGLVLTATSMNSYVHQVPVRKVYNATAAGTGSTFANPGQALHLDRYTSAPLSQLRPPLRRFRGWRGLWKQAFVDVLATAMADVQEHIPTIAVYIGGVGVERNALAAVLIRFPGGLWHSR
jgi:hypothetical protein